MKWRRNPRVLWRAAPRYLALCTVDGRTVEVDGPGVEVWARLADWTAEEDLTAALARDYAIDDEVLSSDVRSLLRELHAQGYVDRDG